VAIGKIIDWLEGLEGSLWQWLLAIFAFYFLRVVLDLMLGVSYYSLSYENIVRNEFLWYLGLFLAIVLVINFAVKERIGRVSKAVFVFWLAILFVPVIDFFFSGGKGYFLTYVSAENFWREFFSFFGFFGSHHFSYGQTITSVTGMFLVAVKKKKKTSSTIRTSVVCVLTYLIGFFYASLPIFFPFGLTLPLFVLVILEGVAWGACFDLKKLSELSRNLHLLRSAHYVALLLVGIFVFSVYFPELTVDWMDLLLAVISCFFAFQGTLVVNNLYDGKETGFPLKTYKSIGLLFLLISLYSGFLVNPTFFMIVLSTALISISYSAPPIRFKRFGCWNNAIIGLESALAFAAGFLSQTQSIKLMPLKFFVAAFVVFSIAGNIKDLKDLKQDKKEGIRTIPVIFGKEKGLKLLAVLTSVCFPLSAAILGFWQLFPIGIAFGLVNALLLLKFKTEKTVFATYFLFLALVGIWILFL